MGVQGLWSLVGPAARPTQLESLRQKKIAVDASIWIHQFMRTMRDKEGNALRNGHLLGFFRRLCKLIFFDIKPVFVFDGGAPSLKRITIRERRKRREGVKTNLRVIARKILSAQVKSRVLLEEEKKLRGETAAEEGEENYVYIDELEKTAEVLRKKRKMDQYELPEITKDDTSRLNKLDPRLATTEEIQSFVDEFAPTADMDIDSESFQSLPPEIQYEVIQDLKNKSRQTSWARLDQMVRGSKSAMDFSKHQIKLLKHRNDMMQRLIQMNTLAGGTADVEPARIAGERGRQYILYKNENINEGLGWKLPGLSAAEPVVLDPVSHPEPKLEVPIKSDSPKPEPVDKVQAAVANNPKLTALFANLLSDDEEAEEDAEEKREAEVIDREMEEEDEPLFSNPNKNRHTEEFEEVDEPGLLNDMRAYMDDGNDEAINQVISRMYDNDPSSEVNSYPSDPVREEDAILTLSADDFFDLWVSRISDAFLYLHSFNDEHKKIIRNAIEENDDSKLYGELKSIRKQYGKTNERDELALESLQFHESFLESVIEWKERNREITDSQEVLENEFEDVIPEETVFQPLKDPIQQSSSSSPLVLDDDEDEENIQFIDAPVENNNEGVMVLDDEDEDIQFSDVPVVSAENEEKSPVDNSVSQEHVHIDINQSLLHQSSDLSLQNVNDPQEDKLTADIAHQEMIEDEVDQFSAKEDDRKIDEKEVNKYSAKEDVNDAVEVMDQEMIEEDIVENETEQPVLQDRGYNSEDELDENTHGEDDEYARFVSDIASKHLDEVRTDLYKDMQELNKQQRKDMGNAADITNQMVQDIQELLKLFGVPYIVSPMEAEAQCAELEALSLIDGTITDDSDVFLFGASRVYKNMFNQQRFVECYLSQDIEREMLLNRKKLIQLAFLLGSDYTDGIPGVGPVAAMEILSEFSHSKKKEHDAGEKSDDEVEEEESLEAPLERFRDWYNSGQDTSAFQRKFRKRHKDLEIPDDFPNPLVKEAYYSPTVDKSTQKFEWGQPQLDSLRIFLMEAFGWSEEKADQVLLPVLREMNSKKATGEQQVLGSFFNVSGTVSSTTGNNNNSGSHKHSSKRVQNIVDKWRKQKKTKTSNNNN